ncbi:MAG: restriction endonuclease [Bosea sp.]|nr:restriction endonuclease [Bosea sp. (in: a-proteobacteria)]
MSLQADLFNDLGSKPASLLVRLLDSADTVLVKKLSNNDRDWARFSNKHQAGVYMPPAQRDGGFFPPLVEKERDKGEPIREAYFRTVWPAVDETRDDTRLVHYTSKGSETHMTRLPKEAFRDLDPASFLVMAQRNEAGQPFYECLTISSTTDDALLLADLLDMQPDFRIEVFNPKLRRKAEQERILDFAEQVIAAWLAGQIAPFAKTHAVMPATAALAEQARTAWLVREGHEHLDPWKINTPGNALRDISRSVEWELFREFQRRERAVTLVRLVMGDMPGPVTAAAVIRSLIDRLPEIDALMLSAAQQRKSRAGYSFEHHIEAMLAAGRIPFEKQVIMDAKKRPDFVLPSLAVLRRGPSGTSGGLILSAKTTLRERWKQVQREMGVHEMFLATVDETVAGNAIEDMATMGITLVVPEALKTSKDAEYDKQPNVLGFRQFFDAHVRAKLAAWRV